MSAVPAEMSAVPAVTMQDLELEHAELLPARETLCYGRCYCRFYPVGGPPHYGPVGGPMYYGRPPFE
jgi:hypothetical protein